MSGYEEENDEELTNGYQQNNESRSNYINRKANDDEGEQEDLQLQMESDEQVEKEQLHQANRRKSRDERELGLENEHRRKSRENISMPDADNVKEQRRKSRDSDQPTVDEHRRKSHENISTYGDDNVVEDRQRLHVNDQPTRDDHRRKSRENISMHNEDIVKEERHKSRDYEQQTRDEHRRKSHENISISNHDDKSQSRDNHKSDANQRELDVQQHKSTHDDKHSTHAESKSSHSIPEEKKVVHAEAVPETLTVSVLEAILGPTVHATPVVTQPAPHGSSHGQPHQVLAVEHGQSNRNTSNKSRDGNNEQDPAQQQQQPSSTPEEPSQVDIFLQCCLGTTAVFMATLFIDISLIVHDLAVGGFLMSIGVGMLSLGGLFGLFDLALQSALDCCRDPVENAQAHKITNARQIYGYSLRENGRYLMKRGIGIHPDESILFVKPNGRPYLDAYFKEDHDRGCAPIRTPLGGTILGGLGKLYVFVPDLCGSTYNATNFAMNHKPEAKMAVNVTTIMNASTCYVSNKILFHRTVIHPEAVPQSEPIEEDEKKNDKDDDEEEDIEAGPSEAKRHSGKGTSAHPPPHQQQPPPPSHSNPSNTNSHHDPAERSSAKSYHRDDLHIITDLDPEPRKRVYEQSYQPAPVAAAAVEKEHKSNKKDGDDEENAINQLPKSTAELGIIESKKSNSGCSIM